MDVSTDIHDAQAVKMNSELIVWIEPEGFVLDWQQTDGSPNPRLLSLQNEMYAQFQQDPYPALFHLGFSEPSETLSESVRFLYLIAAVFLKALARTPDIELLRERTVVEPEVEEITRVLHSAPYMQGAEHLNFDWLLRIWDRLNDAFAGEIAAFSGSVADFFASRNAVVHPTGRIFFHLVESKQNEYPFAFLATYSAGLTKDGKAKHLPLKNALVEYHKDHKKLLDLLATVNKASEESPFIAGLVESGEIFHPLRLSAGDAYIFLKEVPLYETAGILCRIPKWWKSSSNALRMSISIGNKPPSHLGFDALVDFNAQISLGGEPLDVEELRQLLREAEGLAFLKGKWVEVDHKKLEDTLKAYERAQKLMGNTDMNIIDAMRFQWNASKMINLPQEACDLSITHGEWLNTVIARLTHPDEIKAVSGGSDFHADLREYQEKGLAWLYFMKTLGLGACLADDMGLGKTLQVIALLNYIRGQRDEKTLLVIPASLIGNWLSEIKKFAPSLRCLVLHPSQPNSGLKDGIKTVPHYDIFLTTYAMMSKYPWLTEVVWDTLVLDEAQAIKNPVTKQAKAVKQIRASYKIAMTGTPVENRLSDLWSLFDFLNQGLLGNAREFTDFTKQLRDDPAGYAPLKRAVSPFILRRLKTDKAVIRDLPDKIEMKTFATLSKKQVALYTALVHELKAKLESSDDGIQRKGLILSSLMKFKQICNHPDQYLGQEIYDPSESGKFDRLGEICETIYAKRERMLVFTQFKEITAPLQEFLESVFHHPGLVLHGQTPVSKRQDIVAKFQGAQYVPFMVLSIKAGGVGLNLTSANHVVHFDRWWNPAVENQATDRAFRIGQNKNVIVHKFLTRGTIEEKIDLLIEEKTKLAQEIIPSVQESWLTEMDNHQLMDLFRLSI